MGKPEILILDDSASALDYATDAALRKALAALPGSLTVFIVSQRAASLQYEMCIRDSLEPTLRQGREHNTLPWYHLGLPHPCGHSLNAAAALLLTAGRCNGRSRCRLSAHAPRPHSSETIFGFLFPALFHRPGFLVRINVKAYSSLHSHFCDIAFIIIQSTGFVNTYNEVF